MGFLSRIFGGGERGAGESAPETTQVTRGKESSGTAGSIEEVLQRYLAGKTTLDQTAEVSRMSIEDGVNKRLEAARTTFFAFKDRAGAGLSRIGEKLAYAANVGVFAPAARAGEAISAGVKHGVDVTAEAAKKGAATTSEFVSDQYYFTRARAKQAAQAIGDFAWNSGGQEAVQFGRDFGEAVRVMTTGEPWEKIGHGALETASEFGADVKYVAADLPKDEVSKFCMTRLGKTGEEVWGEGADAVSRVLGDVKDKASSKYDAAAEWTTLKTAELAFDARKSFLRMEKRVSDARDWAGKRVDVWKLEREATGILEAQRNLEARRRSYAALLEKVSAGGNA